MKSIHPRGKRSRKRPQGLPVAKIGALSLAISLAAAGATRTIRRRAAFF